MPMRFLAMASLLGALTACGTTTVETVPKSMDNDGVRDGVVKVVEPAAADNTAQNAVDADGKTLTPLDQSESEADVEITANIRKGIMQHADMSINADNCKIITINGVTTLRGVVATADEKTAIEAIAKKTAGVARVDNQLEVKVN